MLNYCTTRLYYYFGIIFVVELLEPLNLKELIIDSKNLLQSSLPGFTEITYYNKPSMELFYREIFMLKVPALLKGNLIFLIIVTVFKTNVVLNY